MRCKLRLPFDFKEYGTDAIVSDFDNLIDHEIEKAIKDRPLFSRYSSLHFNAKVWWNDELGYWCGEVFVSKEYIASYLAETLEELANEISVQHCKASN
jgi:hypothetical protein